MRRGTPEKSRCISADDLIYGERVLWGGKEWIAKGFTPHLRFPVLERVEGGKTISRNLQQGSKVRVFR